MRLEDFEIKIFDETLGLYRRGEADQVPEDHFSDCLNIDYEIGEWKTRPGLTPSIVLGYGSGNGKIRRFASFPDPLLGLIVLILDDSGNLYTWSPRSGDIAKTPKLTIAGAIDFSAIKMFNHIYIAFHDGTYGLSGQNLKVFIQGATVASDEFRNAAGLAPSAGSGISAADGAAGIVNAGVYKIAVSYITTSGFITQPGPKIASVFTPTSYTAPGSKKISLTSIPTGPAGTAKRQILITKAGLAEYFFLSSTFGGLISDNTTTTATLNFDDTTDLVDSADYLFDLLETIPAPLLLQNYNARLVIGSENANPSILRISRPGEPESIDSIDGTILVNKDDGYTVRNAIVIRKTLYVWKNLGVFAYFDNTDVPSSWSKPDVVCQTTNVGIHGIAEFFTENQARMTRDWTLLASVPGIELFDGIIRKPPITDKINDIWQTVNYEQYQKIVLVVDEDLHKIYCSIPTDHAIENNTLIIGDYNLCPGKIPESKSIKWSIWRFNPCNKSINVTAIGMFGVPPEFVPTLKIGSIDGGGKIWKLDPSNLLDDGADIESSFQSALLFWNPGNIHFFTASRLRIIGSGIVTGIIKGEDDINSTNISSIQLASLDNRFIIETPAGIIDGVNVTFACSTTGLIAIFQNGLLTRRGADYIVHTDNIEMTVAPQVNDTLLFLRIISVNSFILEVPGADGFNFVLSNIPGLNTAVAGWRNGVALRYGIDFVVLFGTNTIVMTVPPSGGETFYFLYTTATSGLISSDIPDPSLINGINAKYTLANNPIGQVVVLQNGLLTDKFFLNLSTKTITMFTPPQTNDTLQFLYFVGSNVPGQEKLIRFNFQNEKAKIQFRMTAGRFTASKLEVFGKSIYPMRPQ